MLLPEILKSKISEILTFQFKRKVRIFSVQSVSGGDVNSAAKIVSSVGDFFVKWNDGRKFPAMFYKEFLGLKLLDKSQSIKIPKIVCEAKAGSYEFLLLEFIDEARADSKFWYKFGESLAKLHKNTAKDFGLDHDNYIGSLIQSNQKHSDWISFFIEERIQPQLKLAFDAQFTDRAILSAFKRLFTKLNEVIPKEPPALLHGDLWSGNFMITSQGDPCLIDPAVYYGHREVDISMTKLFGEFPLEFYEAYNATSPLDKGWKERLDIYNLYPLLVHVNLFGGAYVSQVFSILRRF
ncbi:MAG: fructosamine kinase family protein [Bacteroidetes bacterium]|nr:fructosamine kinase family protein [Bacteroidota bacterium]